MKLALAVVGTALLASTGCRPAPSTDVAPNVVEASAPSSPATPDGGEGVDAGSEVDASVAARAFVCVPPITGGFDPCPKGAMAGDDALRECRERHAHDPARQPTFRVGSDTAIAYSKTRWRCVAVAPDTKVHVTVDTVAGIDVVVPSTCASGVMDLEGPNFYGAVYPRCSPRARASDEIVTPDTAPSRAP